MAYHLPGHPLPALVELTSTDAQEPVVDLFFAGLSRPLLLSVFSLPGAERDASVAQLRSLATEVPQLLAYKPELRVFGLSVDVPREQADVHAECRLPFPLLSDTSHAFCDALELPRDGDAPALARGTLLVQEGQVTRLDYELRYPSSAGTRAMELLQRAYGDFAM